MSYLFLLEICSWELNKVQLVVIAHLLCCAPTILVRTTLALRVFAILLKPRESLEIVSKAFLGPVTELV